MTGTVTVTVHRAEFHPLYKKRYRVSKKFLADSAGMDLAVGDLVLIAECRPLSKNKHFKVTEIIKAAPRVSEFKEEEAVAELTKSKKKDADSSAPSES